MTNCEWLRSQDVKTIAKVLRKASCLKCRFKNSKYCTDSVKDKCTELMYKGLLRTREDQSSCIEQE